ncbi:MAG: endonuclease [Frankiales bacterium]|jgi:hypothetical protein|nr:endonuclease [Frankiales bacterium]
MSGSFSTVVDELDLTPFDQPLWRADLGELQASVRQGWQRYAEQAVLLARLAAQVPRDRREDAAWKSFVREIAVVRRCSDRTAAKEIALAVALVTEHPHCLALVRAGQLPDYSAKVLVEETASCAPAVRGLVDAELAERACRLSPARIREAVRRIELRHDADAAAARAAKAARARGVQLYADRDDQATLVLSGPALPLTRHYEDLTARARAARAAGDVRSLDALRFDLALPALADAASLEDRRRQRPVQVLLHLPVTTALGLDNEPGWLTGYGWVSAPQCRQWLPLAELRQVCVNGGQVVDVADRVVRSGPTPAGVRDAVLAMVSDPGPITEKTWRTELQHDPGPALRGFVDIRDVVCDGPTGARVPAARCDHDHDLRYPDGPTAAWNLKARAGRTHLLKHRGWTPLRTGTSTLWISPAGQLVEVDNFPGPAPELDPEAELPDPDELHALDALMLAEVPLAHEPPWCGPPPF